MEAAFETQWQRRDLDGHCEWVSQLLRDYYDPMYEYQLEQRTGRVLFTGCRDEVIARAVGMGAS